MGPGKTRCVPVSFPIVLFLATACLAPGCSLRLSQSAATAPAAPVWSADNNGWGQAVNGLRMRLVLASPSVAADGVLGVVLEVESIEARAIVGLMEPSIVPVITLPGWSYSGGYGHHAVITAEDLRAHNVGIPDNYGYNALITSRLDPTKAGDRGEAPTQPEWRLVRHIPAGQERLSRLGPGHRLRTATLMYSMRIPDKNVGVRDESSIPGAKVRDLWQPQWIEFRMPPGQYILEATYTVQTGAPSVREAGYWTGRLTAPPVSLKVTPATRSAVVPER